MSARTFTAAQWAGTAPLPSACRRLLDGSISCCKGSVCHSYYPPVVPVLAPRVVTFGEASVVSRPAASPSQPIVQTPRTTMPDLLSGVSTLVGRSNTTSPVPAEAEPSLLSTVGTYIGGLVGVPAIGGILGTIGDAVLSTTPTTSTPGRATTTSNIAPVRLEAGGDITYPGDAGERCPPKGFHYRTAKVKRLVRLIGVTNAAAMLGLTVPCTAMIAIRPYRRRGISAAALRTTRRTIRAVNAISHSLSCIKTRAPRRRCA